MKFFYLFFCCLCLNSYASTNLVLKCLGSEEADLHAQKVGGAFYHLNRDVIGMMVQIPATTTIKSSFAQEICADKTSKSLYILRLILREQNAMFKNLSKKDVSPLIKKSIDIFVAFVSRYQDGLQSSACLWEKIPQLKKFLDIKQHFEADITNRELLLQLKGVDVIMDQLLDPKLKQSC